MLTTKSRYRIVSYCPDRHIRYDGETPYERGVGGGITARVRMAKSLASMGHEVEMVINCDVERWIDGVHYRPLDQVRNIQADVLILNTSGGDLDLSPALSLTIDSALRIVWAHGTPRPGGLDALQPNYIYAVSNFIRDVIDSDWKFQANQIFVAYNAYEEEIFKIANAGDQKRDPFQLVYFSHPSKGLDFAGNLLRRLRDYDHRYHLDVFGGEGLWGGSGETSMIQDGVTFHGLIPQRQLCRHLLRSSFSIQLQTREEPGALSIVEAMRAGCIVIGSAVGCYPEYIEHGRDGFIYSGAPEDPDLLDEVASEIHRIVLSGESVDYVRKNASQIPWSSDAMANVWQSHWDWLMSNSMFELFRCQICGGGSLLLEDGYHCTQCGKYSRSLLKRHID